MGSGMVPTFMENTDILYIIYIYIQSHCISSIRPLISPVTRSSVVITTHPLTHLHVTNIATNLAPFWYLSFSYLSPSIYVCQSIYLSIHLSIFIVTWSLWEWTIFSTGNGETWRWNGSFYIYWEWSSSWWTVD